MTWVSASERYALPLLVLTFDSKLRHVHMAFRLLRARISYRRPALAVDAASRQIQLTSLS
jgi:hypothetical protein